MKKIVFFVCIVFLSNGIMAQNAPHSYSTKDTVIIMEDGTSQKYTWDKKYQLFDVRTMDSNAKFKLVSGLSKEDLCEFYVCGLTILVENRQTGAMCRTPKDIPTTQGKGIPPYLTIGFMSHSTHNGFPRYIFMEGNDTGLDDEIWCLDTKSEEMTHISVGHNIRVLENDNIRISISVIDDKTGDTNGGEYDQIITPTGEIVWKGDV